MSYSERHFRIILNESKPVFLLEQMLQDIMWSLIELFWLLLKFRCSWTLVLRCLEDIPMYVLFVVYHFTCSCDTNKTYIGMSSRHLSTRVQEHLNFNSNQKSSIKDHIMSCNICSNKKTGLDSFKIIRKCRSEYDTKIHEALLIKKHSPALNRQLYANGSSFLLQVF